MRFDGQIAMISGAASGMGLCFAREWVKEGGNVVMCDINEEGVTALAKEIGPKALPVVCDVRDYAAVCAARDKAVEAFGRIDVVVNFAGGTATRMLKVDREKCPEFPDVPIEVYDWGIDVNLRAQLYMAHAVMKVMREQKSGCIVNIGSITGLEGDGYGVDYATAKSGVMYGLTKSLAQAGAKHGIRCVCVSPGPILTRAAMAKMPTLLDRAGEPEEVIDLILYLVSEKGAFIDGSNIMIDGGRAAMLRRGK